GLPLLHRVFGALGAVRITLGAREGAQAEPGDVLATLEGDARALLAGERLALNLLQHLSGIATLTRTCVERVRGTRLVVRDTRKTVPGLRLLAKEAVRLVAGRVPLEASGGIGPEDLPEVAATGVDYVAMGMLTHSAPAADLSLKLAPVP